MNFACRSLHLGLANRHAMVPANVESGNSRRDSSGYPVRDWAENAANSVLLRAVGVWRQDVDAWFEGAFERLPETVRVNPLRPDFVWVEEWLEQVGAKKIDWFSGVGSAWEFPFNRGKAEDEVRVILNALHETGRLTRQEAVSMVPAIALDAQPGEIILDLCASPGSKTTQIAEHLANSGVVMANEVVNGRINTLVSNVQRHAARTVMVIHHDGRSIPKVPETGFDRILVDAPCTGSATTRKNPDVWRKWRPSGGRSLHKLQVDLLGRALDLVKPGGRVVYSTCSLDPIENEAVVAAALRASENIRLVPANELLPTVPGVSGWTDWPLLDDEGNIVESPDSNPSHLPPKEFEIIEQLPNCLRIWNDVSNAGGFFIAILEKSLDSEQKQAVVDEILTLDRVKPDLHTFPQPIDKETLDSVKSAWNWAPNHLWKRGKSLLWSTPETLAIWESERSRRSGRTRIPGGRWRPLRVIHLGLIAVRLRKGEFDRVSGRAAPYFATKLQRGSTQIPTEWINNLLTGEEPPAYEILLELDMNRGSHLLIEENGETCLPVWIGGRVSLMISEPERRILRAQRGLPIILHSEEE